MLGDAEVKARRGLSDLQESFFIPQVRSRKESQRPSHWQKVWECLQTRQVTHHDVYPDDIVTWRVIYFALKQFKEVDHVPWDEPLSSPPEEDDPEHQDLFDTRLVNPDQEPDLYPPLTPIRYGSHRSKSAATLSPTHPPPYAMSHLANDDEDITH
ncbi:hypothetical protein DUI87_13410 [Hirundo rustica rustica]|uniref:Uncharacterized protein n=1 Tax=Hirundo rustica rustica TaxID=333673 RepID=A0A3M0KEI0_HIRRU|nr:hypothetical protein DUI87_13410 [Hirundo rustica rustica]